VRFRSCKNKLHYSHFLKKSKDIFKKPIREGFYELIDTRASFQDERHTSISGRTVLSHLICLIVSY